jgi:hypothetical protein
MDASSLVPSNCGAFFMNVAPNSGPGDLCPDQFWLEIQDVDTLAATSGSNPSKLEVFANGFSSLGAATCGNDDSSFREIVLRDDAVGTDPQTAVRMVGGNLKWTPIFGPGDKVDPAQR